MKVKNMNNSNHNNNSSTRLNITVNNSSSYDNNNKANNITNLIKATKQQQPTTINNNNNNINNNKHNNNKPISINQFKSNHHNQIPKQTVKVSNTISIANHHLFNNKKQNHLLITRRQSSKQKLSSLLLSIDNNRNNNNNNKLSTTNTRSNRSNSNKKRRSKYFLNLSLNKNNHNNSKHSQYYQHRLINKDNLYINNLISTTINNSNSSFFNNQHYYYQPNRTLNNDKLTYSHRSLKSVNKTQSILINLPIKRQQQSIQYKHSLNYSGSSQQQQNKYQHIRSTMKRLKNLTQIKLINHKSNNNRLKTTQQQWTQIQKIVSQVCKSNHNNVNEDNNNLSIKEDNNILSIKQKYQQNFNNEHKQLIKQQQDGGRVYFAQSTSQIISNQQTNKQQQQIPTNSITNTQSPLITNDNDELIDQIVQRQQQLIISNQHNQSVSTTTNNNNFRNNATINRQFNVFYSLLLVYQHIFNSMDIVMNQVYKLCQSLQIDNPLTDRSLLQFNKQLYYHRKYLQLTLSQLPYQYQYKGQIHGFTQLISQIQQDNHIIYQMIKQSNQSYITNHQANNSNNKNNSNHKKRQQKVQLFDQSLTVNQFQQLIHQQKQYFVSSNIKLIKKILKHISKQQQTIQSQFHTFINYSACVINLYKSYETIQKIISYQLVCQYQNQQQSKQQQHNEQQVFLYRRCNLMNMRYLLLQQKQFSKLFNNKHTHHQIQSYYTHIIQQIKSLQSNRKSLQQSNGKQSLQHNHKQLNPNNQSSQSHTHNKSTKITK